MIIDGIDYPYQKFARYVDIARALIHIPKSHFKHYSFLINKSKVISIGFNDVNRPSKLVTYRLGGRHSEADSLSGLRDLNIIRKCHMINIRLNSKGELRNSCPCPTCLEFLTKMGIKKIFYSTDTNFEYIDTRY